MTSVTAKQWVNFIICNCRIAAVPHILRKSIESGQVKLTTYSSPSLIRPPYLPRICGCIREVAFGEEGGGLWWEGK